MKRVLIAALATLVMASTPVLAKKDKPTIGVAEFRNSSGAGWWRGGLGWELAGMLTNELAGTRAFRVVERDKLEAVVAEQNLAASGRIASGTGAKIGNLTGAQYLVMGTVTAYEENVADTGGGVSFKGISVGGRKEEAYIAVDLRVVDSTSGEIAYSRTIEGRSKGGGLRLGARRGGFGGDFNAMNKTPAGKAVRAAMMEITDYLECAMVKQNRCLRKFDEKEERRRESNRGALDLDG